MAKLLVSDNVRPLLVRIVAGIANVAHSMPPSCPDLTIRYGSDGEHKANSLHYKSAAVDLRTKNLDDPQKTLLFVLLNEKFPAPRFDVLFEDRGGTNEHIHIEDNRALLEGVTDGRYSGT